MLSGYPKATARAAPRLQSWACWTVVALVMNIKLSGVSTLHNLGQKEMQKSPHTEVQGPLRRSVFRPVRQQQTEATERTQDECAHSVEGRDRQDHRLRPFSLSVPSHGDP